MEKQEILNAIAPCGIDCVNCPLHEHNITEEMKNRLAAMMGKAPQEMICQGCRSDKRAVICPVDCPTLTCSREKGVDFCFQCPDFPCEKLTPAADRADKLPHNLKVYNSCRMKKMGLEKWLLEDARTTATRYYKGRMVIGKGPVVE
ncbi:MAG: DUF3795 domain-containing protein [Synergistales bacterium]|nr:DUF3795 domain-containing protein [Synergistales bacterium]